MSTTYGAFVNPWQEALDEIEIAQKEYRRTAYKSYNRMCKLNVSIFLLNIWLAIFYATFYTFLLGTLVSLFYIGIAGFWAWSYSQNRKKRDNMLMEIMSE